MPYLIDGHNLIPKIPGLQLSAVDDETQLIVLLQEFCRRTQKKVEVYFDNAPPGQLGAQTYGRVTAFFVRAGKTADQAIHQRLKRLGGAARNWTVVSSDQQVQTFGRAAHAQVMASTQFAGWLVSTLQDDSGGPGTQKTDAGLSPEEVDDWLAFFTPDDKD